MASTFNEQVFEQKLSALKESQESINALSVWCQKNKEHHKAIVNCWLHHLKRVKIDQRLSLFYLANDVIQYSKRKHLDFVDSWATALQKATPLVRDEKVRQRILRIFKIWEERGIYDEAFVTDLCGLLTTAVKTKTEAISNDPAEFQPVALVRKIRDVKVLGENTDVKYRRVRDNTLPLTDAESMRMTLKERAHGSDVAAEVDSGVKKMEAYVKALELEISSREKLVEMLQQSMIFYETQRGEAKLVANAYRSFGGRLKNRQKALEELIPTLLSPLPSPDINAPSPSPDSDLELHDPVAPISNGSDLDFSFVNSSFIGSAQFMDIHKELLGGDRMDEEEPSQPQAIPVLGASRDQDSEFNVTEFLKSLVSRKKETTLPPPPVPPAVFADWGAGVPWAVPPTETPQSPPIYEKEAPHHVQPVEYDDSLPVMPISDVDHRNLHLQELEQQHCQLPGLDIDHRGQPAHHIQMEHRVPPLLGEHVPLDSLPPTLGVELPSMEGPPPPLGLNPLAPAQLPLLEGPPPPLGINLEVHPPYVPPMMGPPPHLGTERGAILAGPAPVPENIELDHRNLISLTTPGDQIPEYSPTPINNSFRYEPSRETSYQRESAYHRRGHNWNEPSGPRNSKDVNVENVDMEVSDDEESHRAANVPNRKEGRYPSVLDEHLRSAGAKIIPPAPVEQSLPEPDKNGYPEYQNYEDYENQDQQQDYHNPPPPPQHEYPQEHLIPPPHYQAPPPMNYNGPPPRWHSPRSRFPRPHRPPFPYRHPHQFRPRW